MASKLFPGDDGVLNTGIGGSETGSRNTQRADKEKTGDG